MSNPQIKHKDGTYTPLATLSKAEWYSLNTTHKMSDWARNIGRRQITVNSEPRVIKFRGKGVKPTPNFGFGPKIS